MTLHSVTAVGSGRALVDLVHPLSSDWYCTTGITLLLLGGWPPMVGAGGKHMTSMAPVFIVASVYYLHAVWYVCLFACLFLFSFSLSTFLRINVFIMGVRASVIFVN